MSTVRMAILMAACSIFYRPVGFGLAVVSLLWPPVGALVGILLLWCAFEAILDEAEQVAVVFLNISGVFLIISTVRTIFP